MKKITILIGIGIAIIFVAAYFVMPFEEIKLTIFETQTISPESRVKFAALGDWGCSFQTTERFQKTGFTNEPCQGGYGIT